jgi:hypothetical protein
MAGGTSAQKPQIKAPAAGQAPAAPAGTAARSDRQKKFRDAETLAETLKLGLEYALREQSKGAKAKLRRLST